jgi:aspartate aminotransferase
MYSNPPGHGVRIVSTVFQDPQLLSQWRKDIVEMATRMKWCRETLVANLAKLGSKRNWSHISAQIGMFAYSGLNKSEVEALRSLHVYMNKDGRMSVSGINSSNIDYLAESIHKVTK